MGHSGRPWHCIADAERQVLRCERCGEEVPMPLGLLAWLTGVIEAFVEAHKDCKAARAPHQRRRTGFAVPVVLRDLLVAAEPFSRAANNLPDGVDTSFELEYGRLGTRVDDLRSTGLDLHELCALEVALRAMRATIEEGA